MVAARAPLQGVAVVPPRMHRQVTEVGALCRAEMVATARLREAPAAAVVLRQTTRERCVRSRTSAVGMSIIGATTVATAWVSPSVTIVATTQGAAATTSVVP